jgi:hypothetical protein
LVQSLYPIINDRGVKPEYTPVMWNISVPSRVHIFLWLLSNNKTFTRDNLEKGRNWMIIDVCSVMNQSRCHIYFLNVVWPG